MCVREETEGTKMDWGYPGVHLQSRQWRAHTEVRAWAGETLISGATLTATSEPYLASYLDVPLRLPY